MAEPTETGEKFRERLGGMVVAGYSSLAVGLAHELGIFDVMIKFTEPKTPGEIADALHMKERYIKELLGALVQAQIIDLDESGDKYILPPHRGRYLVCDSPVKVNAVLASAIARVGHNLLALKECFKENGPQGIPFDSNGMFSKVVEELSGPWLDNHLVQTYVPNNPEIAKLLEGDAVIIDVGCGSGKAALCLAKAFPNITVYGIDFLPSLIENATKKAEELQLSNCHFEVHDNSQLPNEWTEKFDLVTMFDAVHDQPFPKQSLQEVWRILKPNGILSIIEPRSHSTDKQNLDLPGIVTTYVLSLFVCLPAGLHSGGAGFGAVWGKEKAEQFFKSCGFEVCSISQNHGGIANHFLCKKKQM